MVSAVRSYSLRFRSPSEWHLPTPYPTFHESAFGRYPRAFIATVGDRIAQMAHVERHCVTHRLAVRRIHDRYYSRMSQRFQRPAVFDQNIRIWRGPTIGPFADES